MDVTIIGGHGQVARHLTRTLTERGDRVRAVIRDPEQQGDVEDDGATAVLHDIEREGVEALAAKLGGTEAVVFAAGAGPGSGSERKWTVDHRGAVRSVRAAEAAGVRRFVMLSAMGTDEPPTDDEVFSVYLRAKAAADAEVRASSLDWTVLRPGGLTDDDGTGEVTLARHVPRGEVPRADVAAVLAACLHDDATAGHVLELVSGDVPVETAIADLAVAGTDPRQAPATSPGNEPT